MHLGRHSQLIFSKSWKMATNEPFKTFKQAAAQLGLPCHKIQRAARRGLFPTYRLLDKRPLVRVSEVVAAIEASRVEGELGAASISSTEKPENFHRVKTEA
jgi:hypothetical protein